MTEIISAIISIWKAYQSLYWSVIAFSTLFRTSQYGNESNLLAASTRLLIRSISTDSLFSSMIVSYSNILEPKVNFVYFRFWSSLLFRRKISLQTRLKESSVLKTINHTVIMRCRTEIGSRLDVSLLRSSAVSILHVLQFWCVSYSKEEIALELPDEQPGSLRTSSMPILVTFWWDRIASLKNH